jgi:predicted cupin superfamily sugar epimerase
MLAMRAVDVIEMLGLEPLEPEGGYFRRTYASAFTAPAPATSSNAAARPAGTAIYYLMTREQFSSFHRVKCDEVYHYYAGASAELTLIDAAGLVTTHALGNRFEKGERPQIVIPAGTWQACRILDEGGGEWCLVGATVTPGFEWVDFEIGERARLINEFPKARATIERLTREEKR